MDREKMHRVNRQRPCPICRKPDWCLVATDRSAAICQRIQEGSTKRCGEAGWLHLLRDDESYQKYARPIRRVVIPVRSASPDFAVIAVRCQERVSQTQLQRVSDQLGVSVSSLKRLGIGWNGAAYTFPMSTPEGRIVGLRLRFPEGRKSSEKGSRQGLFIPCDLPDDGLLLICEGASDTAAALNLSFAAVGRPSCNTGARMLSRFASGREVAIIADNDTPGRKGAEALASELVLHCPSVKIVYPPADIKDLRQWKQESLVMEQLETVIESSPSLSLKRMFQL